MEMDILIMRASTYILANDTLFFLLRVVKIVGIGKNPVMLLNVYQHGQIVLQVKLEENTLRIPRQLVPLGTLQGTTVKPLN